MVDNEDHNLTIKQLRVISIMLSCKTISEGCRKAHISRETWYSYMRESEFKKVYESQQNEIVKSAINDLKLLGTKSVEVLGRLLSARSEHVRHKTAIGIIDSLIKAIELEEVLPRLEMLEQKSEGKGGRRYDNR